MTLAPTYDAKSYSMFISATHMMFCPNFSKYKEFLTYFWAKIGAQGNMSLGVTSRGTDLSTQVKC